MIQRIFHLVPTSFLFPPYLKKESQMEALLILEVFSNERDGTKTSCDCLKSTNRRKREKI